jgi:hypothetical protein
MITRHTSDFGRVKLTSQRRPFFGLFAVAVFILPKFCRKNRDSATGTIEEIRQKSELGSLAGRG